MQVEGCINIRFPQNRILMLLALFGGELLVQPGGDDGDVRVRFYHTMAGNAAHDLYLDVVALYQ